MNYISRMFNTLQYNSLYKSTIKAIRTFQPNDKKKYDTIVTAYDALDNFERHMIINDLCLFPAKNEHFISYCIAQNDTVKKDFVRFQPIYEPH